MGSPSNFGVIPDRALSTPAFAPRFRRALTPPPSMLPSESSLGALGLAEPIPLHCTMQVAPHRQRSALPARSPALNHSDTDFDESMHSAFSPRRSCFCKPGIMSMGLAGTMVRGRPHRASKNGPPDLDATQCNSTHPRRRTVPENCLPNYSPGLSMMLGYAEVQRNFGMSSNRHVFRHRPHCRGAIAMAGRTSVLR